MLMKLGQIGSGAMLLALLGLAACGDGKQAAGGTETSIEDKGAAELARFQAEENARSRVTIVDAATGDAAGMPAEWSGPTAYDLRPTETETGAKEVKGKAEAPTLPQPVVEELPSVAE